MSNRLYVVAASGQRGRRAGYLWPALKAAADALMDAVDLANIQIKGGFVDEVIERELRLMCEHHGYGNVIASASSLWRKKDSVGAFTVGHCLAVVKSSRKLMTAALSRIAALHKKGSTMGV